MLSLSGLQSPGSKSSEFLVMVLNVVAQIALAWSGTLSDGTATKYGLIGTAAYIISRGLAKYEGGSTPTPPTPPAG